MRVELKPGDVVSHYQILELLGRGGMGMVYKARDARLDRLVALKFLVHRAAEGGLASDLRVRFEREARAISSLSNPHIGALFDVDLKPEIPFLVLEYLPGGSLQARMKGQPMPLTEIRELSLQIGEGLRHAHRHGVVHRDLKPGNILFDAEGRLKIVDFGISKLSGTTQVTIEGVLVGTTAYMAPELILRRDVDQRGDLWALGVMLYQMATGTLPFQGENNQATLYEVVHSTPEPIESRRPDLPASFCEIVRRALEKDPARRYQRADEMLAGLGRLPGDSDSQPTVTIVKEGTWLPETQTGVSTARPRLRSRRWWAALAAAVAFVLAAVYFSPLRRAVTARWFSPPPPAQRHVLVLPFENVSKDPVTQAFCDGLADSVVSVLSQVERFQRSFWVVPASEVRAYPVTNVHAARRFFNAHLVINGSVQRTESDMQIILNLVDAATVRQLGSRIIPVKIPDEASLPNLLLSSVVELMDLQLSAADREQLSAPQTTSGDAYDLYLQGRGLLARRLGAEHADQAITILERAVRKDPRLVKAHAALAEAYLRKYLLTKDLAWLGKAEDAAGRAKALDGNAIDVLMALGSLRRETGQNEEAVKELARILELDPGNAEALTRLAGAYRALKQYRKSEEVLREAIRRRPGYWVSYTSLGSFYWEEGRYKEAEEMFLTSSRLVPENPLNYRNLGGLYMSINRYEDAVSVLEKSLRLEPTSGAYSNLGTVLFLQGRFEPAANNYRKAVELMPKHTRNWGNLAEAYSHLPGREQEAIEAFRKAKILGDEQLKVNPSQHALQASVAFYEVKLGLTSQASERMSKALAMDPENVQVLYRAVCVYELLGQREKALDYLARAVARGYQAHEVRADPALKGLRDDPRFKQIFQQKKVHQ
jgi:serine/threonine protein kinase/tetratricopeptide (TPR) repeat protein